MDIGLEYPAQYLWVVGDDAVDAPVDGTVHVLGAVHSPGMGLEAVAVDQCDGVPGHVPQRRVGCLRPGRGVGQLRFGRCTAGEEQTDRHVTGDGVIGAQSFGVEGLHHDPPVPQGVGEFGQGAQFGVDIGLDARV